MESSGHPPAGQEVMDVRLATFVFLAAPCCESNYSLALLRIDYLPTQRGMVERPGQTLGRRILGFAR
jgi:hypothetical protein